MAVGVELRVILFARPIRLATLGVRLGFGVSPMIGASGLIGDPGRTATSILDWVGPLPAPALRGSGWLYIHVAERTTMLPMRKAGVMGYAKRRTDARKDRMMLSDVAKPLRMLSEYLMTIAVTSPPRTWVSTVAHAQTEKFANGSTSAPASPCDVELVKRTGRRAGMREKKES